MDSLKGHLLIAGADLWDPNFRRTVVLIGHHDDEGAVGVVLNRATEVPVSEAAPPLAAVVVADFEEPGRANVVAFGSIGFLPDESDGDSIGGIRKARVFAGHAGWGPGQLEAELEEGSWIVEPALEDDVFNPDPERLWSEVLRRKGRQYDLLRLMPPDPSLN